MEIFSMAVEKFIRGKVDSCHHDGKRSTLRRLDAARAEIEVFLASRDVSPIINQLASVKPPIS